MTPLLMEAIAGMGAGGNAEAIAAQMGQKRAEEAAMSKDELQGKRDLEAANKQVEAGNKKLLDQLNGLKNPMGSFNDALGGIQIQGSAATTILSTFGNMLGKIPLIGPQIQELTMGFAQLEDKLKGLAQFVAKFSPFDASLLSKAFDDLNASFGEQLVGVIRSGTQVVRWFGDSLAGLTPIIRPLIEQGLARLTPLFQILGDAARESIAKLTPLLPLLQRAFDQLGDPRTAMMVHQVGELMVELTKAGVDLVIGLAALDKVTGQSTLSIGLLTESLKQMLFVLRLMEAVNPLSILGGESKGPEADYKPKNASQGKAFQQASVTSPEALLTKMQTAAFGMGSASDPKLDSIKKSENWLEKISDCLIDIAKMVEKIKLPESPTRQEFGDAASGAADALNPVFVLPRLVDRLRRSF